MKIPIKIITLVLVAAVYSSVVNASIFSNSLRLGIGVKSAETAPKASTIFQKHIGAANPVRWARQLPGTANTEAFLLSPVWQATRSDFLRIYGNNPQVNQYLNHQEYLFRRAIRINNKAHFRSLDIKGNLAESLMDDFYRKDGWEIIDGKRGRNGFDGLYVRRNKNGTITDWIVTDAKSGAATLSMTSRGMQLSKEWVDGNLKDLLAMAEEEYRRAPSPAAKQRIADLRQIMSTSGRRPRIFTMKIENNGGRIQYRLENIGINGNPVGKPMFVDMNVTNSGTMLRMEQAIYRNLEKHISVYDPQRAPILVKKVESAFKNGTIKSDADLYRFIKREIPDKKLAMAVTQELGEKPPRGSLAGLAGKQISKKSGIIISAVAVAGFIIANDAMGDGISANTFLKAGLVSIAMIGTDVALGIVVRNASRHLAKYILKPTGRNISTFAVTKLAGNIATATAKYISVGIPIGLSIYSIGDTIYKYNKGYMTQTDMLIYVGIESLTTAGIVLVTCAEWGGAIGLLPGLLIGTAIGAVGGIAVVGYTKYVENKRQKNLLYEARLRASWETEDNHMRLQKTISDLNKKSEQMRSDAWNRLLPAS